VEPNVVSRSRFACLLPLLILIALRTLAHANPVPLPWTSGVFDAQGLDDILQTIRIPYVRSTDVRHVPAEVRATPTGRIAVAEATAVKAAFLVTVQSRAPPSS
jgi:hypothetical protein